MKIHDPYYKLEQLVKADLKDLQFNSIIPDGKGVLAFGKYSIQPDNKYFVCKKDSNTVGVFSSKKTALSWCIADKYKQFNLSNQILTLDSKQRALFDDIEVRSKIANKSSNNALFNVVENKLETKRLRLAQLHMELDKCINLAKYWQIRGFNNEISRTGRPASHR